jgi:hypothetical protein
MRTIEVIKVTDQMKEAKLEEGDHLEEMPEPIGGAFWYRNKRTGHEFYAMEDPATDTEYFKVISE